MRTYGLFIWAAIFGCLGWKFGDAIYYWILLISFVLLFVTQFIFRNVRKQVLTKTTYRGATLDDCPDADSYRYVVPSGERVIKEFTPGWAAFRFALAALPFAVIISAIVYGVFW